MNRRSIRCYRRKEIPEEKLKRVLDAGRWAPSAHNSQPWRFLVLQSKAAKLKLATTMGEAMRQDREKDGGDPEVVAREVRASINRFTGSPVIVLVSLTMQEMDVYPDKGRQQAEQTMAVQSVAAAIQSILLATQAEGLASCWFCAPLFCQAEVRDAVSLPKDWIPQAVITMGYPAETPPPPERLALQEIVKFFEEEPGGRMG